MWIQLFEHKCFILPSSPQKIHQWPTAAWKCSPSLVISEVQIKITLSYIISHLLKWRGCYQKYIACVCCFISESCLILYDPMDCSPRGSSVCGDSPGKNTRVGCHASPGDVANPGIKPGLPQCRQILYPLSSQGSPRTLEWVAYPFSSWLSRPRNWTGVSCITGGFVTNWVTREADIYICRYWQWCGEIGR